MCATTERKSGIAASLKQRLHAQCLLCGAEHPQGLRLVFNAHSDGHVETELYCDSRCQGYVGCLHGGVISALLDSAMTNRLLFQGLVAMIGEPKVRFVRPVAVNSHALISTMRNKASPRCSTCKPNCARNRKSKQRQRPSSWSEPDRERKK